MTWWMEPSCSGGCDEGPYLGKITWPCPPNDCGWTNPPYPQRPPPFPHPQYPGPMSGPIQWSANAPAFVGKGDACCGSCSEGHACESECKDKKKAVGALYVSDDELNALGEQIAKMNVDVGHASDAERAAKPGGERGAGGGVESQAWIAQTGINKAVAAIAYDNCKKQDKTWDAAALHCDLTKDDVAHLTTSASGPQFPSWPLTKFLDDRWSPLAAKWNSYMDQTFHEPTVYDTLRNEFSALRDEWTGQLGQTTRATVPEREASGFTWEGLPWGWIALGTGIVILPFILPSLTALYLVATRGSKLGLGGLI